MHFITLVVLVSSCIRGAVLLYFLGKAPDVYPRRLLRHRPDDAWLLVVTLVTLAWAGYVLIAGVA